MLAPRWQRLNFANFLITFLGIAFSGVQPSIIHLAPTPSHHCARCICEQSESCDNKLCDLESPRDANSSNTVSEDCGPFNLSLSIWKFWGQKRLVGDAAAKEIIAFRNCAADYDCSAAVIINYTSGGGFPQDCDNDNKFSCTDIYRIYLLGPLNCKKPPGVAGEILEEITSEAELKWNPAGTIGGIIGGIVIVAALSAIFYCKIRRQACVHNVESSEKFPQKKTLKTDENSIALRLPLTAIIPPDEITIDSDKLLGEGQFGKVYEGEYNNMRVAVKAPKLSFVVNSLEEFQRELEIMARIGDHQNIVRFYGAEISQISRGIAYVVLQLSRHGALLDFMRAFSQVRHHSSDESAHKNDEKASGDALILQLLDEQGILETQLYWSEQIASGMNFLESKNVLHGDLAARNILLFDKNVVKISDFGFSRNLGNYDDYEKNAGPLPWRWLAPESLERRIFSLKSDTWAFGVTVWEIFTLGLVPYTDLEKCSTEFLEDLVRGVRLQRPAPMTPEIYNILLQCWDSIPDSRPNFEFLTEFFDIARRSLPNKSWDGNYEEIFEDNRLTCKRLSIGPRYSVNPCK